MDEIKLVHELKLCGVKRDNLGKQLEKVHSQASDILLFTLQWRDLEDYLKSAEEKVENRFRELVSKETELKDQSFALEERAKVVEAAEAELVDLKMKSDEKREELDFLRAESNAEELRLSEVRKSVEECSVEQRSTESQLNETVESLKKTQVDLERRRVEVSAEIEQLDRTESRRRELDEEIERKTKDLALIQDKTAECGKMLEKRSSEVIKTQGELELNGKQLGQMKIDLERLHGELSAEMKRLDRSQSRNRELDDEIKRKTKDLTLLQEKTTKCGKLLEKRSLEVVSKEKALKVLNLDIDLREHSVISLNNEMDDIQKLIKEHNEELASKEKRQNEKTETIRKLSLQIDSEEKTLEKTREFNKQLSEKLHSKEKELDSTTKELCAVKDKFRECVQNLEIKENELKAIQSTLAERNKLVEEGEKKMQDLNNSIEELVKQLKLKQEDVCAINNAIKICSSELDSKRKHRDQVQTSITDLTAELKSKECDLDAVKKKIQDSSTDLRSEEEKQVRLKASLMEREQRLELKEKELDKKDKELKSLEQRLATTVKDYEMSAKKLSSFVVPKTNADHHDLVRNANVTDNKTLQLVLTGQLKKCPQLHLDVSRSLKASPDPAKLVLDTIQGLYSAHRRSAQTDLDPNSVKRSSMFLLECFMDMSLKKPMTGIQEEAMKFATEWKNATLVKAENPVEVLGFLHFLAAFSLAYAFDDDKVKNLFDVAFLRKYSPSLCKALGISALAPVNNVLSLDDMPEQQPPEVPINSSEDALRDFEGSASFAPNEVSLTLPTLDDPGRFVLSSVEEALTGAQQRKELGLAEPIVKNLVQLLEELARILSSTNADLQSDATKVAYQWSLMMRNNAQKSQLESWAFLQFIVAYGLVKRTKPDETLKFASYVAHFKEAPKLFESLGHSNAIPNFVELLLKKALYIPAIRFMLFFNVKNKFSPLEFLKEEIMNLRRSAKEKRRFESQVEDRDAAKMRDIIELIDEFKLGIDLPVDLILKFMVPRESQNQKQCVVVSSSVPVQPPQIDSRFHMKASQMTVHSSNPSLSTSFGSAANPQVLDVETYQAGGSTVGFKRQRVDPRGSRPAIRPCQNPPTSGYGRF